MLVVISDLHLTDGTTGKTISLDAFRLFCGRLEDMAYNASYRAGGKYRPITEVNVLLLGDLFDLIRSDKWLYGGDGHPSPIRPWDDPGGQAMLSRVRTITRSVIDHNARAFEILRNLSQSLSLPPATERGVPDMASKERVPVRVRIYYMLGNHDWFLHLPGAGYDQVRQEVIDALGLMNTPGPFPHDPAESTEIQELTARYRVFARHGDIFDSFNYNASKGRDYSTLGDAVTIDLFNRFPLEVRRQLGDDLPESVHNELEEMANVRPTLFVPVWIDGQLRRMETSQPNIDKVKGVWNQLVDEFFQIDFVRDHDNPLNPFETADALKTLLKLTQKGSFSSLSDLVMWVEEKFWGGDLSFAKHAVKEQAFIDQTAQYFVYGHIHNHEIVPLATTQRNDHRFDQIYFNTGTWHSVHALTRRNPQDLKFVGYQVMTHLTFFRDDERGGRPYEMWSGVLSWKR